MPSPATEYRPVTADDLVPGARLLSVLEEALARYPHVNPIYLHGQTVTVDHVDPETYLHPKKVRYFVPGEASTLIHH